IDAEAQRVNRIRAKQVRIAETVSLREVVKTGIDRGENVFIRIQIVRRWLHMSCGEVTAKQRMFVISLVIDPADELVLIGQCSRAKSDQATWIRRLWQPAGHIDCRFAEQGRIDLIADEWSLQRNSPAGVAGGGSDGSKISGKHRRRRNE